MKGFLVFEVDKYWYPDVYTAIKLFIIKSFK